MLINAVIGLYDKSAPEASKATKDAFLKALGVKNDLSRPAWPLPNMKETDESTYWGWRASRSFLAEAWADTVSVDDTRGTLLIYWLDNGQLTDGGFAVLVAHQRYPEPSVVRYFEWRSCDHDFVHKTTGNCQHRYTCRKCKSSYDVDSSG